MARARAGDQHTGRELDNLPDEKERGITIKSAAITLNLNVPAMALEHSDRKFARAEEEPSELVDVYVGNLPRGMERDDFVGFLKKEGILSSPNEIAIPQWNSHRGFAILQTSASVKSSLGGLALEGRPLVVQQAGGDALNQLKELCQEQSMEMPHLAVKHDSDSEQYAGVATWISMGDVIIQARGHYPTQKEARQAAAQECLHFWCQQTSDHKNALPLGVSSKAEESRGEKHPADKPVQPNNLVPMVINLIDSPGHIEFNAEVTAALRLSDGALVVVDAVEGKSAQTDNVLRQALREGVVPVLMLNKVDRLFVDKQLSPKDAYDRMVQITEDVNRFIAAHQLSHFPDLRVSFEAGSVCFGSGYFQWSCSIDTFLPGFIKDGASDKEIRAARKNLAKRENFIKHIVRPIVQMHRACGVLVSRTGEEPSMADNVAKVTEAIKSFKGATRIRLLGEGEDPNAIHPRKFLKAAMSNWLPAADALVNMVASHVPSPARAQPLRASLLYSGEVHGDSCGRGIFECNPSSPTVVYISKMSPSPTGKRLLAFGRVFSGTVRTGSVLRALRTDGTEGTATVSKVLICCAGGKTRTVPEGAGPGQLVALEGIDAALHKAGTLTSSIDGKPIRHMEMVVSPIFQQGVAPKNKSQLTKFVTAMQQVVNADPTAQFFLDKETRQYILAASGELHIEVLISLFHQTTGIELELSDPIVAYREGIQKVSGVALAKSANKHNRIWIKASPLDPELLEALASGGLDGLDHKSLRRELVSNFGWSTSDASRIWSVGPEPRSHIKVGDTERPTCMLVDSTFGLQIPQDGRENIVSAFQQVVQSGVLVHAPMRGVRFDLVDAKFHPDSVHRRPNAVVPAASRAMQAAFLMGDPCLLEPMYDAEIVGEAGSLNGVYAILGERSATIVDTASTPNSDSIQAFLPVRCSVGLSDSLHHSTKGQAHCTCVFGGMKLVPESETEAIIVETRKQKSLPEKLPRAESFVDKL